MASLHVLLQTFQSNIDTYCQRKEQGRRRFLVWFEIQLDKSNIAESSVLPRKTGVVVAEEFPTCDRKTLSLVHQMAAPHRKIQLVS